MGRIPDAFRDSTFIENAMLNLSQPMHFISVVRGGKHSSLRSHAYFSRADPAPPAQLLPRDVISDGVVGVTMVGSTTPAQKAAALKAYDVRISRLSQQLKWYRGNNDLYSNIRESDNWEADITTMRTRVVVERGGKQVDETEDERSNRSNQTEADELQRPNNHRSEAMAGRRHDDIEVDGIGAANDVKNCENLCGSNEMTVDNDDGSFLHSRIGHGCDELDRAMWRHNAPTPAHQNVRAEDEEQAALNCSPINRDFVGLRSGILGSRICGPFPYGRGGLDETRSIQISLLEFVRYCLRLSTRCHAQHRSFALVAFDVIARHKAMQAISIKARMSPQTMDMSANAPREELRVYVQHQQDRLRAITEQRPLPDAPEVDPRVQELYSNISTGMRAFWGSNDERSGARANLFSMQLELGQPAIFFTLSPDSSTTFRIANLAGEITDDILMELESGINSTMEYSRAKLGQIATANPYICARYFDRVVTTFIDAVLNWDLDSNSSRSDPGLFGCTKAFYAATESQNSTGSLHTHMLIWIAGMPSTVDKYYQMCSLDRFRAAMIKYVDSIATSNVPLDTRNCPSCRVGLISRLEFHRKAFRKPCSGSIRPPTTVCDHCGQTFGGSELIMKHAQSFEQITSGSGGENNDIFRRIASTKPLPRGPSPSSTEAITTTRALEFYQHYHWFHSSSCFKKTKRTPKGDICRMFMPKEACPETRWTNKNRIEMKRLPGNEYINTYVPLINSIFKCNHDVKFLGAGEGPEKAYYTIKYATKPQHDIENPWALHLHAFDKANERLIQDSDDPTALGRRRVQSMCCTLTNPHEVSAPMACLYLLNESAMYSSHLFVKLHLTNVLRAIFQKNEPLDVRLEEDGSMMFLKPSTVWLDYIYRPTTLESLDLMSFVAQWERKKSKTGKRFLESHTMHEFHSLFRMPVKKIVTVYHKRLPDIRRPDLPTDERLRYQQSVMTLFRPFRGAAEFDSDGKTFAEFFKRWLEFEAPPSAHLFMKHNTDYYASRELLRTQRDSEVDRYFGYEAGQDEDEDFDDSSAHDVVDSDSDEQDGDSENGDYDIGDEFVIVPTQPTKNIDMLKKSNLCSSLAAGSTLNSGAPTGNFTMSIADVEQCMRGETNSETSSNARTSISSLVDIFPELPTRVQMLKRAIQVLNNPTQRSQVEIAQLEQNVEQQQEFPSLEQVSSTFHLNHKQDKMFFKIGTDLLTSCLVGHLHQNQCIAFLGGLPGAGKSRVIGALQALAKTWNSPQVIATAAYQGVAAQAANGQTIHKLFGWYVNSRKQWTPTTEQKERFASLKLLILDEVSTCDVCILGKIDASLRILLDCPDKVFGGIHVLMVGDWLQQLPVAGQPAFMHPDNNPPSSQHSKMNSTYLDRIRGANAYKSVNWVVILTDNMRHQRDPTWRSILDKWRTGRYDQSDIDLVNEMAYRDNWGSQEAGLKGYCPIIVTSNTLRVEFNVSAIRAYCLEAQVPLHRFPATVTRARFPLTETQRESLENIRDDKTSGMPLVLEIAVGSIVQCKKNVSTSLKLANGSIGTVVAFTAACDDVVRTSVLDGVEEYYHSLPPHIVFVHLKDYASHQFVPSLPPGVVPLCKRKETGVQIKMQQRTFSISICQVPVVPAYSLTTEKCQGLTVEKMILAPLRHPTRRIPQHSSFYVAVTRVTTLKQLYLMEPLTKKFLEYFVPNENALQEHSRLKSIEEAQSLHH